MTFGASHHIPNATPQSVPHMAESKAGSCREDSPCVEAELTTADRLSAEDAPIGRVKSVPVPSKKLNYRIGFATSSLRNETDTLKVSIYPSARSEPVSRIVAKLGITVFARCSSESAARNQAVLAASDRRMSSSPNAMISGGIRLMTRNGDSSRMQVVQHDAFGHHCERRIRRRRFFEHSKRLVRHTPLPAHGRRIETIRSGADLQRLWSDTIHVRFRGTARSPRRASRPQVDESCARPPRTSTTARTRGISQLISTTATTIAGSAR